MASKSSRPAQYENNPFFVAANGITLLFSLASGVGIFLIVLSVLGLFSNTSSPDSVETQVSQLQQVTSNWNTGDWILGVGAIAAIGLAVIMVTTLFSGVSSYTSARLARGKKVNFGEAFHVAFENLWTYLWLQVIIFVKLVLWTLLFIIPGIIMSIRYSLAGVAFYDEKKNLRGNAAIQESVRLTRGAWITTFSSNLLFNLLTFGAIGSIISTGVNAVLYKQFEKTGDKKPDAHWLSWLTLALPITLLMFALIVFVTFVFGVAVGKSA